MIKKLQSAIYKNGYLLITSAWLFTLSFITYTYLNYNTSAEKVASKIQLYVNESLSKFADASTDTSLVSDCLNEKIFTKKENALLDEQFGFFVFSFNDLGNPFLGFWSSNKFYVRTEDVNRKDGNYSVSYQNGDFILAKRTVHLKNRDAICIQMIPIRWSYFIENKYLKSEFVGLNETNKYYEISYDTDAVKIFDKEGSALFGIKSKAKKEAYSYDNITIALRVLAIVFLALFINGVAADLVTLIGFYNAFSFFLLAVVFIRTSSYLLPFPFDTTELGLFDPSIYASNFIHPSLGDLFVNTIFIFWLVSFYRNHRYESKNTLNRFGKFYYYFSMILITLACLGTVTLIRDLVIDSKISFDVTNFFSLSIYSFISFIILCFLVLTFFYLTQIFLKPIFENDFSFFEQLIGIGVTGLIFLSFNIGNPSTFPNLIALLWLIIYILLHNINREKDSGSIIKSSMLIFWIMFFAVSLSSLIIYQNKEVELQQRKRDAELLSLQTLSEDENIFKIAFSNFDDHFFSENVNRLYSEYSNKFIKDSLLKENFSGYLNKYDTRIYTYDSIMQPLHNDDSTSYNSLRSVLLRLSKSTEITGLYSFKSDKGQLGYFLEKTIKDNNGKQSYLFVTAKPKRLSTDAVFPVLFKQSQDFFSGLNANYAYAIYQNGRMVKHNNDFDFPLEISLEKRNQYGYDISDKDGFSRLWYFGSNDKQVLIVKKNDSFFQFVALFAYLFSLFLIIIIAFISINFLLRNRFKLIHVRKYFSTLNIKSQINLIIIAVCFVSFLIIGIATISFFIVRFNNNNEDRLFRSIKIIGEEIQTKVNSHFLFDDVLSINDIGLAGDLERKIAEIAESHAVDVNFYDLSGKLRVSTQPYIYNKYLLCQRMNPLAFYELSVRKKIRVSQTETIGKLSFLSLYIPITDETGKTMAYLNIPYLNSQVELNQEISGFLATLINLNAFIFLLAGAIAFIVANRITSSFSIISAKMKELSLGKVNEPIQWNRNDEIGELVNEYNIMVSKLDESANALAKAERETAWREMATQVAHEIKNPLTPMKLSIQYLQKNLQNESEHIKQLSQHVSETLIEQIDQLSKIAGDFTQFANINNAIPREMNIVTTIQSVINMHSVNANVEIELRKEREVYMVYADKTQINRLFTNLIKNAIEAAKNMDKVNIKVIIEHKGNKVLIMVADNGSGIPSSLISKIFTPNFTTKSSGTGLGLAICKGIVENANGKIWFETKLNQGTIFFIELPLEEE